MQLQNKGNGMGLRKKLKHQVLMLKGHAWWLRSSLTGRCDAKSRDLRAPEVQHRMFFILGSGRSGTQLLSSLFEKAGVASFHEPNFYEDVATMDLFRRNLQKCEDYWHRFRACEVMRRWEKSGAEYYCEVNGTIRYHAPAIRSLFPLAKLFLCARDGRGVVRSVMGWKQFYGPRSKGAFALAPLPGDPFYHRWTHMSRFEKVYWSWRESNEFVMAHVPPEQWLRIEDIVRDYDYFRQRCLDILGLYIPENVWRKVVSRKSPNSSKKYEFPSWEDWTIDQKKSFIKICGETMQKLGYEI